MGKAMKEKKAMKLKKAMKKVMKAMKKKKKPMKKVSARTLRRRTFKGDLDHTPSQMKKGDLMLNHRGKIVSKKMHEIGQKRPWMVAVVAARKALKIKGLAMVKKGTPLYNKAKELMAANKK